MLTIVAWASKRRKATDMEAEKQIFNKQRFPGNDNGIQTGLCSLRDPPPHPAHILCKYLWQYLCSIRQLRDSLFFFFLSFFFKIYWDFNTLSKIVTAFLPKSQCLLTSWLPSPSALILESKKIKFVTISIVSSFMCHEVMGLMPWS